MAVKHMQKGKACSDPFCWCKGIGSTNLDDHDLVNNPPHYKITGTMIEALDVIKGSLTREEYIGYLRGNILKYHIRARMKGGEESMSKAHFYSKELDKILNDST